MNSCNFMLMLIGSHIFTASGSAEPQVCVTCTYEPHFSGEAGV